MARQARLALPGYPHHLQIRGNNQQLVFLDSDDQARFLEQLRNAMSEHKLTLHAHALLPNEIHLLATPIAADGLSRCMQSLGRRYVAAFNARHQRSGTLWEGRFRAHVVAGPAMVLRVMRYIECLPQNRGVASALLDTGISSLPHHLGARADPLITEPSAYWGLGNTPFEREAAYRAWVEQGVGQAEADLIAGCLRGSRPLAEPGAMAELERIAQRSFTPRRRGRPRKATSEP
ncbi:MAG: transposase [Vitreoscilla sp.]|nr:transposase [Vitreoscilla sp.]